MTKLKRPKMMPKEKMLTKMALLNLQRRGRSMRAVAAIALFFVLSASARAQVVFVERPSVPHRIGHFFAKHELLISDGIIASSFFADAGSSIACQNSNVPGVSSHCTETNPFLGKHPGPGATVGYMVGFTGAFVALDHALWHVSKNPDGSSDPVRHLIWMWTTAIAISEFINIRGNVNLAECCRLPKGGSPFPYPRFSSAFPAAKGGLPVLGGIAQPSDFQTRFQ